MRGGLDKLSDCLLSRRLHNGFNLFIYSYYNNNYYYLLLKIMKMLKQTAVFIVIV